MLLQYQIKVFAQLIGRLVILSVVFKRTYWKKKKEIKNVENNTVFNRSVIEQPLTLHVIFDFLESPYSAWIT